MCIKVSLIVCLTIVTKIEIATFRPCSTGLHSVDSLFVPPWLLVTGVSRSSLAITRGENCFLSGPLW